MKRALKCLQAKDDEYLRILPNNRDKLCDLNIKS